MADEVRREVIAITDAEPVRRDWSFRKQIRDACDSACANFAEGFGRHKHKQFAHFIRIVRGSLNEIIDQLDSALQKQYAGLIRWLEANPDPADAEPDRRTP